MWEMLVKYAIIHTETGQIYVKRDLVLSDLS